MYVKGFVLLMLVLSGCTGVSESGNSSETGVLSQVSPAAAVLSEKLDARYDSGRVIARVISSGCTRADQFSVSHHISEGNCVLSVVRDAPDFCKRASFALEIEIAWPMIEECQAREIVFANPPLSDD